MHVYFLFCAHREFIFIGNPFKFVIKKSLKQPISWLLQQKNYLINTVTKIFYSNVNIVYYKK